MRPALLALNLLISNSFSSCFLSNKVIGTALSNRHCQFIRVGLAGNALGERGVAQLASALEANTTLTTLDIRSNGLCGFGGLGDSGFGITALQQSLSTSGCRQLYRLDLRGNHFSQVSESLTLNLDVKVNVSLFDAVF